MLFFTTISAAPIICVGLTLQSTRTQFSYSRLSLLPLSPRHLHLNRGGFPFQNDPRQNEYFLKTKSTQIVFPMGFMDFLSNPFLKSRDADFIPLEKNGNTAPFGTGPLILMHGVPESIDNEELEDMIEDGMPNRKAGEVTIYRLQGGNNDLLLGMSVADALEKAMELGSRNISLSTEFLPTKIASPQIITFQKTMSEDEKLPDCPILYFSGVTNQEMMETYQIMANEIYEETNLLYWPACAKLVPPAMSKSLRKVLTEIGGDHDEAMKLRREDAERMGNM